MVHAGACRARNGGVLEVVQNALRCIPRRRVGAVCALRPESRTFLVRTQHCCPVSLL